MMALFERGEKAIMEKATDGFQSAVSLFSTYMECAHQVYTLDLCLLVILYFNTNVHKGRLTTKSLLGGGKETTKLGQ